MAPKLKKKAYDLAVKLAAFPEVQELVQASHSAIATTQYDYAGWAQRIDGLARALSSDGEPNTNLRIMAAEALRLAGGDSRGIDAAMGSFFGIEEYDYMARLVGNGR